MSHASRRRCVQLAVWVVASAWAALPIAQTPRQPADQPAFRTGVDIVSLNVTALAGETAFVTSLTQADFEVYEDGVKQDVQFFASGQLPIALSLLLDTSASMETRMRTVQEAAVGFARHLRANDLAQVIDFDSRVRILQQFTPAQTELETAIFATAAGGSTALYNAIYISLKELAKMRGHTSEDVRREAVVVLSDGEDTSSLVGYEEVLELAKRSETAIYAIGLRAEESGRRRGFNEAEFVLRQLSRETGGRAFFLKSVDELAGIYDLISEELSSQYTLGYVPKNPLRDGAWRRVVVRILRDGTTARTKQGYYAPTEG